MPTFAGFVIVLLGMRPSASNQPKLAIANEDVARRTLRQESAMRTRLPGEPQRAALRAFEQLASLVRQPRRVCRTARQALGVERPLDVILGQAMHVHCAGMVEEDAVRFAVGWTQAASDHLAKQAHPLRRPREYDAA